MNDIIKYAAFALLAVAVAVFGYFAVKKLDAFIGEKHSDKNALGEPLADLRIAVENPTAALTICKAIEAFSKSHIDCSICFYTGTAAQIERELCCGNADIGVFLTFATETPENAVKIPLLQSAAYSDMLSAPFLLIQKGGYLLIKRADIVKNAELADELLGLLVSDKI